MSDARLVLTVTQCRAARQLLGMSQEALSRAAGVHFETVESFESGRQSTFPIRVKLRSALVAAGVEFTSEEPGVKLRGAA